MMRYRYCPNDPARYATNLRREQGTSSLKWDNARGQDVLIVQTPFECAAEDVIEELCALMERVQLQAGRYNELRPGIWVRFVTAADKAQLSGCPINAEACTYTVFACSTSGDVCSIYAPQRNQAMISAYCNIPMRIHVDVREETRAEGFFKKKVVRTGYYILTFPQDLAAGYQDGDLLCRVGGLDIPVTRQMLEQGFAFVKTGLRPDMISGNKGLELV